MPILIEIVIELIGGLGAGVAYYLTCLVHKRILRRQRRKND